MPADQERSATTPRTEAEAKGMGWTVDRHVWPWIAYLGPRFDPDRLVEIETPAHGGGLPATPPIREGSTVVDMEQQLTAILRFWRCPSVLPSGRLAGSPCRFLRWHRRPHQTGDIHGPTWGGDPAPCPACGERFGHLTTCSNRWHSGS